MVTRTLSITAKNAAIQGKCLDPSVGAVSETVVAMLRIFEEVRCHLAGLARPLSPSSALAVRGHLRPAARSATAMSPQPAASLGTRGAGRLGRPTWWSGAGGY